MISIWNSLEHYVITFETEAMFYLFQGKFYRDLAREADEKASREIFEAR